VDTRPSVGRSRSLQLRVLLSRRINCRARAEEPQVRTARRGQPRSLLRAQQRQDEACDLLGPVYSWFTEGFDTADLKQAKAPSGRAQLSGSDYCNWNGCPAPNPKPADSAFVTGGKGETSAKFYLWDEPCLMIGRANRCAWSSCMSGCTCV